METYTLLCHCLPADKEPNWIHEREGMWVWKWWQEGRYAGSHNSWRGESWWLLTADTVPSTASVKHHVYKTEWRICLWQSQQHSTNLHVLSKDNFLKRHSNKHIVFSQRHLPFPKFPSGLLDVIQPSVAIRENTFAVSEIMERKGERFSFILHHEVELSTLFTGFTLDWIW
jgi:hypothetical protein